MLEMEVDGLRSNIADDKKVVVLRTGDSSRYLPIWIGASEAESIAIKLQDVSIPRPLTHDLLESTIVDLGASVVRVVITDLRDETFYASIVLRLNGNTIHKDSRPSDAIALAVRTGAPILASELVVEKAGVTSEIGKPPQITSHLTGDLGVVSGSLSERARDAISDAISQAKRLNHDAISTEHLLLGLVTQPEGVGAKTLVALDVQLDEMRTAAESMVELRGSGAGGEPALTPQAARVLELAGAEARRLNHHWFGTEHMLMGLMREGEGAAAALLEDHGVTLEKVTAESLRILGRPPRD